MCRSDPDLVGAGMSDPVVTPERARLITGYDEVRAAAFDAGATGVTVSGAGPAILAVCRDGAATGRRRDARRFLRRWHRLPRLPDADRAGVDGA